jgi:TolA-binding protein
LYELGWARRDQNEPAKQAAAAAAFEDLARLRPDSPLAAEALYLAAEHYDQEGDFSRAATAYYAAAQKAGMSELGEKAAHKLGFAYFNQKDYEKARQSFAYQRARFPQGELSGDGAFMEAECLFQQGKHAEAVAAYEAVKNPRGPEFAALAALHAGQALAQLKKWNESLAALDRGLAEQAQSVHRPEMTYERAWALQNVGRVDEALEVYAAVPGMTDREAAARACFMIGELQFERRQHAEAIKSFFKAAYGYGYPRWQAASHYEAGRCFEVLGKPDQAKKSYQEVVEKHPMSEQAKLARERLQALGG